jgi:hypothetical protein
MAIIDPKPTVFKGTQYKSRLEARWAVYLDKHKGVKSYSYEPVTFREIGIAYTPDFRVRSYAALRPEFFLEIKPAAPARDYLYSLKDVANAFSVDICVAYGSFYQEEPNVIFIGPNSYQVAALFTAVPLRSTLLFDAVAFHAASGYRFDLAQPERTPRVKKKRRRR